MSNPNNWQNQPAQQPSRWQSNSNWGGNAQQPQQQTAPQPQAYQQGYPQGYQQSYQGAYQGGYQQGYQGYQQPQAAGYAGNRSAYQKEKGQARSAGRKQFLAAMLFAAIFAITCLYGFIFSGAADWLFSINANVKVYSVGQSDSIFSILNISLAAASGIFLVLGVSRERFSWAAAIACWMWAVISILNLVSLMILPGFFDSFKYASTEAVIYYILTLASQLIQTVAWVIVGILLMVRSKSGAKTALIIVALALSVIEYVYPLIVGVGMSSGMLGGTGFWSILMMVVIGLFGILVSRCLAVLLYKPGK